MRKYGDDALTDKDMTVLRETDETRLQQEMRLGNVKDYSLQHRVTVAWDISEAGSRDLMVKLTVDDKTAIVDAEELMRYLRWA